MRTLLLLGSLGLLGSGCTYIDRLDENRAVTLTWAAHRAYFLKRTVGNSKVLVCDVHVNESRVICYDSDRGIR